MRSRAHERGVARYLADPRFRKLASITASWGGSFTFMNADTIFKVVDRDQRRAKQRLSQECYYSHPEGAEASYVVTTHWRRKVLYLSPEFCALKPVLGYLVHEMGHVFADPQPPDEADELAWLGWEIRLARWAGCYAEWDTWKDDFIFGERTELPNNLALLWKKHDDCVCQHACPICCAHAPDYVRRSRSRSWVEWGDLNAKGKRLLTRDRVRHGVSIGIIDPRTGRPLPVQRQQAVAR